MALLEDLYETERSPFLIFDINQIDASLNHMLNKLKNELEDFDNITDAPLCPADIEKYEHLEKEIVEAKEILKEKVEHYVSCKEQLTKLDNASSLTRNLVAALQFALEKICSMVSSYAENDDNSEFENHVIILKASIDSIEGLSNKRFDSRKERIKSSLNSCTQVIKHLYKSYQSIKEVSLVHICPICLNNSVSSFLIPCGHTFCDNCIKKIRTSCFICRQDIQRFSQLYFN